MKTATKAKILPQLEPPDRKRCQAETHSYNPWIMGGSVYKVTRCRNKPEFIAKEKKPDKDGRRGSMSLCGSCAAELIANLGPEYATFAKIRKP